MAKVIVCGEQWNPALGFWIAKENGGAYVPGRSQYIGLLDEESGAISAVTEFSDCNGASIFMHVAGAGRNWLNREFLWFSFYYPFEQLGVKTVISPVDSANWPCRRFIEHIGFSLEATLKDCSPGGDLLVYTLAKDDCRWLTLRKKNEQAETSANA